VLPPRWAAFIWLAATAFSFVVSAWLLGCTSKSPFGVPLALGLFLFCVPILTTLHAGQANGFVLLALAFALFALTRQRPIWTGIGIAVGAMIKLIPVAHLAYLGWRRQWQAALTGLITILLLFGLAIPLIGWSGLASYAHNFLSLGSAGELIASGANQSFNGFFARLFVSDDGRWYLANAPQLARGLWLGAALVLALATAVLCWPITGNLQLFALEFALVTSAISLLTPYVWYHHLVLLLIPFFVLTERALARPSLQWMLIPLAIGYMATDIHGLVWHYLEPWPLLASMPFYTTLMLWGMLAGLIAKEKRQLMARDLPGKTVGEARRA
jgi:hypothetical protein